MLAQIADLRFCAIVFGAIMSLFPYVCALMPRVLLSALYVVGGEGGRRVRCHFVNNFCHMRYFTYITNQVTSQ